MKTDTVVLGSQRGRGVLKALVVLASIGLLAAVGFLLLGENAGTHLKEAFRDSAPPAMPQMEAQPEAASQDPEALMSLKHVPNRVFVSNGETGDDSGAPASSVTIPFVKLPRLNDSDAEVRGALVNLAPQSLLAQWLIDEELIRKFVVTVDNMADGNFPHKHSLLRPMTSPFRAVEQQDKLWLDGYNYGRYTPYIDLFAAMEVVQLRDTYLKYYPLMQRAYAELGYPRRSFHKRLLQAVDHLLQSPVHTEALELVQPSVMYRFVDPSLEGLSDVHKQMLRLGPVNARKVLDHLTLLQAELVQLDHG